MANNTYTNKTTALLEKMELVLKKTHTMPATALTGNPIKDLLK